MSPGYETANQIDHIIIEAKHNSDIMDVRNYRRANIDSNHYLVIAKIRSRITTMKEEKKSAKRDLRQTGWSVRIVEKNIGAGSGKSSFHMTQWSHTRVEWI